MVDEYKRKADTFTALLRSCHESHDRPDPSSKASGVGLPPAAAGIDPGLSYQLCLTPPTTVLGVFLYVSLPRATSLFSDAHDFFVCST